MEQLLEANYLSNGDLIQIGEEIFFANNIEFIHGDMIHLERIDDDGRHPYRLHHDEEIKVIMRCGNDTIGITEPAKWFWSSDAVKAFLMHKVN